MECFCVSLFVGEDPSCVPIEPRLPPHLLEHERDPLIIVPEVCNSLHLKIPFIKTPESVFVPLMLYCILMVDNTVWLLKDLVG